MGEDCWMAGFNSNAFEEMRRTWVLRMTVVLVEIILDIERHLNCLALEYKISPLPSTTTKTQCSAI